MILREPGARRRWAIGLALVVFLCAAYFITFNGEAISRDEWNLFDATESLARQGNLRLNYQFYSQPPTSLATARPPTADTEPLQPALAAPLVWIADALPGIGVVHTVWLFNILITALTAGVFYAYGLALGYGESAAALAALLFGLGTIAWPYSRMFFREPLLALLVLLNVALLDALRRALARGEPFVLPLAGFALALSGALLAKEAALLMLPGLLVVALPSRLGRIGLSRRTVAVLGVLAVVAVGLALLILNAETVLGVEPRRYSFLLRLGQGSRNLSQASKGLRGYLFSPARSVWLLSPILLLGLAGWPRLLRARRWREFAVPLVTLAAFIVGYAIIRGPEWYGGTGWGSRYLVPVVPLLALWLLPVMASLVTPGAAGWKRLAAGALFAISAGIQLLPAWVPVNAYYDELAAQQPPVVPWNEGAWSWRWSPVRVSLHLLGDPTPALAWKYASRQGWLLPAAGLGLALVAGAMLVWWLRSRIPARRAILLTGALPVLAALMFGVGLYAIRQDRRYYGDFEPTRRLLAEMNAQVRPGDVIILNDTTYLRFFMNYYKRRSPTVYTLPASPGERYSPEQPPQVESPDPERLVHPALATLLADLAGRSDRLWLVINSSPFVPWSVRPVEHYLARHTFTIGEIKASDVARAVLFSTATAPPPTAAEWPARRLDVRFGESLRLVGCDLPGGSSVRPGAALPVSLLWQAVGAVERDYTVGLFLIAADGQVVAQRNAFPVDYFAPTRGWRPGSYRRDNHALELPEGLPPGDYELWAVLYWWEAPANRLPATDRAGTPLGDHAVLGTITVGP